MKIKIGGITGGKQAVTFNEISVGGKFIFSHTEFVYGVLLKISLNEYIHFNARSNNIHYHVIKNPENAVYGVCTTITIE